MAVHRRGLLGIAHHGGDLLTSTEPMRAGDVRVLALRVIAAAGGALLLAGVGRARWVLLGWLAYHAVLGAWHSTADAVSHAALLAFVGFGLLTPGAVSFFRSHRSKVRRPA